MTDRRRHRLTSTATLALALVLSACSPKPAATEAQSANAPVAVVAGPAAGRDAAPVVEASAQTEAAADDDPYPPGPYRDRDPELAKQLVEAGALLLDVRTSEEFADGHLAGAVNINHGAVLDRVDEIRKLQGDDPDKPIVLYCRSGRRADAAKQDLMQAGFTRITNLGGLKDWPG